MRKSALFESIRIRDLELANRIVIAPMCQYSAEDGCMNDWHMMHLGHLAISGAALLTIEATAVTADGRITYGDVGLYNDATESTMAKVLESVRRWSKMPVGIQLSHAGRKASTEVPWRGGDQLPPADPLGWQTVAPSEIPFKPENTPPSTLDRQGMREIRQAFGSAAKRADRVGLDLIQLHA